MAREFDRTEAFVWQVEQGAQRLDIATLIDYSQLLSTTAAELISEVERREEL